MPALREALLIGINAALAIALLGLVLWPLSDVPGTGPALPQAAPGIPARVPDSLAPSNTMHDPHPVFWPRQTVPPLAKRPVEGGQETEARPMPRLVGLMVRRGMGLAVFEVQGERETRTLREGETVAGWTLERISARAVRLVQHGQRVVMPLDPAEAP